MILTDSKAKPAQTGITHSSSSPAQTVSRRTVLTGLAAGTAALAMPAIWTGARAAGAPVRLLTWAGYDFSKIKSAFEAKTGRTLVITALPDQDAMSAQMKANGGEGFDICEPTADRVQDWHAQGFIQPIDEAKANIAGLNAAFLSGPAADTAKIGGKRYSSPSIWGTEALCFDKKAAPLVYGQASYGDIWKPENAGKATVRAHSGLVGLGLYLQGEGKLPHPMVEVFSDPAKMTANYDVILAFAIQHKANIAQFWTDENSAQGAFRSNGCVIGQNWDTTASGLIKDKLPIGFIAPKEGALAWLQTFVIPAKADLDAAYAWISFFNTPEPSALWAEAFGANPAAKDADQHVAPEHRDFLAAAYPGDALKKLFWWPAQPGWFVSKRNEYADKLQAA